MIGSPETALKFLLWLQRPVVWKILLFLLEEMSKWDSWEWHFPSALAFLLPHTLLVLPEGSYIARDPQAGLWELLEVILPEAGLDHTALELEKLLWHQSAELSCSSAQARFFWGVQLLPSEMLHHFSSLSSHSIESCLPKYLARRLCKTYAYFSKG